MQYNKYYEIIDNIINLELYLFLKYCILKLIFTSSVINKLKIITYEKYQINHFYFFNIFIKNIFFNDKVLESTIVGIVKSLIDNYSYDLTDAQKKKLEMLSDNIDGYDNKHFLRIDEKYLDNIRNLTLDEINWLKSTQMFN